MIGDHGGRDGPLRPRTVNPTYETMTLDDPGEAGIEFWRATDLVRDYDRQDLRPVEAYVLERYRDALSGRVLELGVGAGRVTRYLYPIATQLHGIDISPAMVRQSSRLFPNATITVRDLREVGVYGRATLDAVVGSFNVIDVLDDPDRQAVLGELAKVLVPGGMLVFSSHNLGALSRVRGPFGQLIDDARHLRIKRSAAGLVRLPRRLGNHARMRRFEQDGPGYAMVNDRAHDYQLVQYYIDRDGQERQLARHGFRLEACYDLRGAIVPPGSAAPDDLELYYVAIKDEAAAPAA